MSMDYSVALEYSESITAIEAQEALVAMKISSYPHNEPRNREKTHKAYHKLAFAHQEQKAMTSEALEDFLKLKGVM